MKRWLFYMIILGLHLNASASYALNRFELAKQAHLEKKFPRAIELLEKEIDIQPHNPAVYFNLGLAYRANKEYPKAIWAFEKSLKLNPTDTETIQLIQSSYEEMDNGTQWNDNVGTFQRSLIALGSTFWSILTIVFSIIAALGIVLYKITKRTGHRKWYLGTSVFALITLMICAANAYSSHNYENGASYAIALEEIMLNNSSNPEEGDGKVAYAPGAKVEIKKWHKDGSATIEAYGSDIKVKKGLAKI